jgi:FAD/FMN-containing dehydrogenase
VNVAPPARFRGLFRQDDDARAVYSEGAGIQRIDPVAVAAPADVDDLQMLVEWARAEGAALVPRGSGSGMAGGAIGRGVIVDLSRWKDFDKTNLELNHLTVGPGVICAQANAMARLKGHRLPVDPSSAAFCTIGGMTATNAAGAHTLAFGSMREWVTGVECIFADG